MIRYTSDPVDNVRLFLKTYAIPDKNFNFMSDATLSGANPEIEKQPGVAPYTALRLPEWDPYKVLQNSYVGPFNNPDLIDKGEGLIETPYQTDLQKSNIAAENPERLKQITLIQQELDRLDKEEAKYNQERQAKRDYYNSDAFLAKVYKLDPKTAEFLAGRMDKQTDKTLEESKIELGKIPKDRSMTIDQLRQQLRIAQETAIDKMNATLDPDLKEQYRKEMQIYVDEAAKDYPSLQAAAIAVRDLQTKTTNEEVNASEWWKNNKPNEDDISKYGRNADGSIKEKTKLISYYKDMARNAGYNSLDKTIENYIEGRNSDMTTTVTTKKEENDRQTRNAQQSEQIIIGNIDKIYPGLRDSIDKANKIFGIIRDGDTGNISARNAAVKTLSRMASDEALTGSDFGQALGRSDVTGLLTGLVSKLTNSNINVTDAEWENVKTRLRNAIDEVRTRRTNATEQIKGSDQYIEKVGTSGTTTKTTGNGTGKTNKKTRKVGKFTVVED